MHILLEGEQLGILVLESVGDPCFSCFLVVHGGIGSAQLACFLPLALELVCAVGCKTRVGSKS